jgi:hypothetical protein
VGHGHSGMAREIGGGRLDQLKDGDKAQISRRGDRLLAEAAFQDKGLGFPMVEVPPGQKQ